MDEQKIVNISVKSLILCVVFGTVCWLVSLKPAGFDKGLLAGILGGITAMTINFSLLRVLITRFVADAKIGVSVLFYIIRLVIYAAGAVLSYMAGLLALIGFLIGILCVIASVIITWQITIAGDKRRCGLSDDRELRTNVGEGGDSE